MSNFWYARWLVKNDIRRRAGKLLGIVIVGEGATKLIHIGQMILLSDMEIDGFIENIFNFPALADVYRAAALNIAG